jgi:hypothetical protein
MMIRAAARNMPSGKMTDEELIKSAMSAAPEAIGKGATIIEVGSDGRFELCVRAATNLRAWPITPTRQGQTQCVPTETQWSGSRLG